MNLNKKPDGSCATMIAKIRTRIKTGRNNGIFHNSREDVNALAEYCNMLTDKINLIIEELNEIKKEIERCEKSGTAQIQPDSDCSKERRN